jgi:uncharacterized protein (DUF58 family)
MWRFLESLLRENRIYIFFTRRGPYYLGLLLTLISISFSYGHSLTYSTTFVFFSLLMVSAIKTNYNLDLVTIEEAQQKGFFPEEAPSLEFLIKNHSGHFRFDLFIERQKKETLELSLRPGKSKLSSPLSLDLEPGCHLLGRVHLRTRFPFEIMHSWKVFKFPKMIYIFPRRINHRPYVSPLAYEDSKDSLLHEGSLGGEDFFAHKPWVEGDSLRFFDWKVYAREKGSLLKTFEEKKGGPFHITSSHLEGLSEKEKGEQISFWLDQAVKEEREFSLELEGLSLKKGSGEKDLHLFLKRYLKGGI